MKKKDIQTIASARLNELCSLKNSEYFNGAITEKERDAYVGALREANYIFKCAFNLEHQMATPFDKLINLLNIIGKSMDDFTKVQVREKFMKTDRFLELLSKIEIMNDLDESIALLGGFLGGQAITVCIDVDANENQYWTIKYVYGFDDEAQNDLHKKE